MYENPTLGPDDSTQKVIPDLPERRRMDRYWLLTWTTYGTWLPGDDRGFVSNVDRGDGKGERLNAVGSPRAEKLRGLTSMAEKALKGPPLYLNALQANSLWDQFQETALHRRWQLEAVAIMRNHVHIIVGIPGDPSPDKLLQAFKSYGSRKLNANWSRPASDTWWTESGSKRKLPNAQAIAAGVAYLRDQEFPLFVWIHPLWTSELGDRKPGERGT